MSLDREHLEYPRRRCGRDHDRYQWSLLSERQPVKWPGDKPLALWINVCLQFSPMNQRGGPFAVPGGMTMPYPFHTAHDDLWAIPLSTELEEAPAYVTRRDGVWSAPPREILAAYCRAQS